MPDDENYYSSLQIKAYDLRGIGCFKYIGAYRVPSCHSFIKHLSSKSEYDHTIFDVKRNPGKIIQDNIIHATYNYGTTIFMIQKCLFH